MTVPRATRLFDLLVAVGLFDWWLLFVVDKVLVLFLVLWGLLKLRTDRSLYTF